MQLERHLYLLAKLHTALRKSDSTGASHKPFMMFALLHKQSLRWSWQKGVRAEWDHSYAKAPGRWSICGVIGFYRASPARAESNGEQLLSETFHPSASTRPWTPHRSMLHIITTTHTHLNTPPRLLTPSHTHTHARKFWWAVRRAVTEWGHCTKQD